MRRITVGLLAAGLAGCAPTLLPTPIDDLVPVDVIVNTVKCEIAMVVTNFETQKQGRLVPLGQPFTVTLKLKTVNKANVSVEAGGDLSILALNSFVPSLTLGAGIEPTATVDTTTKLTVLGTADDISICRRAAAEDSILSNGIGYFAYVDALARNINQVVAGNPKMITDKVIYDATFGVTVSGRGSLKYGFVPLAVTGKTEASSSRTQQVTIEFDNWKAPPPAAESAGSASAAPKPPQRCAGGNCPGGAAPASADEPILMETIRKLQQRDSAPTN
ncbi:hypothetical protein [Xanthobacter pseudotagetidis]|uniref:hypothetical protein n=1 Tax=Xanthobacter pseudotagetidis TaxID=3119911 RepID=UPI003729410D